MSDIALWVEPDGSTSLWNITGAPVSFDAYQISSQITELDPVGWKSINDYVTGGEVATVVAALGAGAASFGELSASATLLAENNIVLSSTLAAGAKFAIGKPFQSLPVSNEAQTFWKGPANPSGGVMDIVYAPEPSTLLLAILAGLGLVAMRVRSKR